MKQNQLDRIIRLVKRTGDRFVILDRATDEAMVVMNLDEYEDLLNTTTEVSNLAEEEMLSRLNRDINRWQEQHEKKTVLPQIQYEESEVEPEEEEIESELELEDEKEEDEKQFEIPQIYPELENLAKISQKGGEIEDSELEDEIAFLPINEPLSEPTPEPINYVAPSPVLPLEVVPSANFAEEDLSDLPEGEEEKFYLEPIE